MARKQKSKIQPFVIKFILIGLLTAGIGYAAGSRVIRLFRHADYFKIRSVVIDPSLSFINKRDLKNLIGKNIFGVDLKAVQRKLSYKYPQASHLKIVKHFPGQIAVAAKQRLPFAQIHIQNRIIILDEGGVMLSDGGKEDKNLPRIVGAKLDNQKLVLGRPLRGEDARMALNMIKLFQADSSLSPYFIAEMNIENLSKIYLTLSNNVQVIVDRDGVAQKIRVLGAVLSQGQLDLNHVKYVDLRFKEPIIGKK